MCRSFFIDRRIAKDEPLKNPYKIFTYMKGEKEERKNAKSGDK